MEDIGYTVVLAEVFLCGTVAAAVQALVMKESFSTATISYVEELFSHKRFFCGDDTMNPIFILAPFTSPTGLT